MILPAIAFAANGGKVHSDGAKNEECEIIIYRIGPATSARVGSQKFSTASY